MQAKEQHKIDTYGSLFEIITPAHQNIRIAVLKHHVYKAKSTHS